MKASSIPAHVAVTLTLGETFDIITTLRAACNELEGIPESIGGIVDGLTDAYPDNAYPIDPDAPVAV